MKFIDVLKKLKEKSGYSHFKIWNDSGDILCTKRLDDMPSVLWDNFDVLRVWEDNIELDVFNEHSIYLDLVEKTSKLKDDINTLIYDLKRI